MEIITANSLADGLVVFHGADGWTVNVDQATVFDDKTALAAALERAKADAALNLIVDPYPIAVARDGSRVVPTRLRERIRAAGPTTGNSKASTPKHDEAA